LELVAIFVLPVVKAIERMKQPLVPEKQGLYDPQFEHDSCGVGFVVDVKGRRSRKIVDQAFEVLRNLEHRGASGCETNSGDGAGILLQIPHAFLSRECGKLNFQLPAPPDYAVGMVFLPREHEGRVECEELFERIVEQEGRRAGWRTVPTDDVGIGPSALALRPLVRQIFIGAIRAPRISRRLSASST
jgi:glutamate synthase (ferredoxin)